MLRGFVISAALHAALLAWAIVSIQRTPQLAVPDTPVIEATIVTVSELTRLKKGDPDAKELEAKAKEPPETEPMEREGKKPKPAPAVPPPPPEPEQAKPEPVPAPAPPPPAEEKVAALSAPPPEPAPAPGPSPEELKKQEDARRAEEQKKKAEEEKQKAEEKRKAEEKKKAEAKKKAEELKKKKEQEKKLAEARRKAEEEKKKKFDASRIAALLDKTPEKRGGPPAAQPPARPTKYAGPTAGEREGKDSVLTARQEQMLVGLLKSQIAPCWRLPGAGGGTQVPAVTLKWRMRPDGTLDGEPSVAQGAPGPAGQLAVDAAIRAVKSCQPYQLPEAIYGGWKEITWEFDPSRML